MERPSTDDHFSSLWAPPGDGAAWRWNVSFTQGYTRRLHTPPPEDELLPTSTAHKFVQPSFKNFNRVASLVQLIHYLLVNQFLTIFFLNLILSNLPIAAWPNICLQYVYLI